MKTKDLVMCALLAAVICILSPISVPIGPVPISLATFAVMLAAAIMGAKWGTIATLIYILLGCVGVPVFAGYSAGVGIIAGSTGGYIIGYLPLAFLTGLFVEKFAGAGRLSYLWLFIGMVLGTVVLYLIGTIWFIKVYGCGLSDAMAWCVTPFIAGDLIKMVVVTIVAPQIRKALVRAGILTAAGAAA